jgi:hypothetical protein
MPFLPGGTSIGIDRVAAPVLKETSIFELTGPVDAAATKGKIKRIAVIEIEINERIPLNKFAPVAIVPPPNRFIIATCHQIVRWNASLEFPHAHITSLHKFTSRRIF